MNEMIEWHIRFLEENVVTISNATNGMSTSSCNSSSSSDESDLLNDSGILKDSFVAYGSLLVVVWILFCWIRLSFPRPFTVRHWTTKDNLKVRDLSTHKLYCSDNLNA